MPYLYLISSVFFVAAESIAGGIYNRKNANLKGIAPLYSFLSMSAVFLFWTVMFCATNCSFDWNVVLYSLLFAGFYTLCNVCMIRALKTGPIVLTSLFMQLSLIGSTVWGFFFWGSEFSVLVGIGLMLVVCSLWLCLYTGKSKDNTRISAKWLFYVLFAFLGNAGCVITQRTQQMYFEGQYGNFLMMIATAISVIICLVMYLKSDKSDTKLLIRKSWYIPVAAGTCNGLLNLFVILLATSPLSPSLIYPVISVGGLMVTTIFSCLVFKEKMRWWQWVGIAIGMVAVGLLSI